MLSMEQYKLKVCREPCSYIWGLAVVCVPLTFCKCHMSEYGLEGGLLRTAGIESKLDFILGIKKMTDAHLMKNFSVF